MRIFNQEKTAELTNYDLSKGKLVKDMFITHIDEQQEVQQQSHYETVAKYPNGGKDVEKVIDVEYQPYIPEHDETEEILVYIPYTERELFEIESENKISQLKQNLSDTDYKAIKFAEGELTEEEYAETKAQRKSWRKEINKLEEELKNDNN